ncbi:hypothetical protein OBBRIDRAFT_451655 [Obba rivulosa]|uniref:C2H2-type domain-containing protein n=1 Tax=Obba rivulosa TaxID=1052685 RepID=A0A8E2B0E1_9APHY|nr:hypothetical protein OBBRIDRAFT_451655 [Obba rivulosa]
MPQLYSPITHLKSTFISNWPIAAAAMFESVGPASHLSIGSPVLPLVSKRKRGKHSQDKGKHGDVLAATTDEKDVKRKRGKHGKVKEKHDGVSPATTGENDETPEVCNFRRQFRLAAYKLPHKLSICDQCEKRFGRIQELNRYMQTHDPPEVQAT